MSCFLCADRIPAPADSGGAVDDSLEGGVVPRRMCGHRIRRKGPDIEPPPAGCAAAALVSGAVIHVETVDVDPHPQATDSMHGL